MMPLARERYQKACVSAARTGLSQGGKQQCAQEKGQYSAGQGQAGSQNFPE